MQATHACAFVPHALIDGVWQVPAPQHPLAQLDAEHWPHTPPTHVLGLVQVWQAAPMLPHAESALPGTHWFAWQQPFGQLV